MHHHHQMKLHRCPVLLRQAEPDPEPTQFQTQTQNPQSQKYCHPRSTRGRKLLPGTGNLIPVPPASSPTSLSSPLPSEPQVSLELGSILAKPDVLSEQGSVLTPPLVSSEQRSANDAKNLSSQENLHMNIPYPPET